MSVGNPFTRQLDTKLYDASQRVDYIHEDKYASLGVAVLETCPLAFLAREDRPLDAAHLPEALRLDQVMSRLAWT
jgi:hypothetical protein